MDLENLHWEKSMSWVTSIGDSFALLVPKLDSLCLSFQIAVLIHELYSTNLLLPQLPSGNSSHSAHSQSDMPAMLWPGDEFVPERRMVNCESWLTLFITIFIISLVLNHHSLLKRYVACPRLSISLIEKNSPTRYHKLQNVKFGYFVPHDSYQMYPEDIQIRLWVRRR